MEFIAATDQELAAIAEDELLGLVLDDGDGTAVDQAAERYAICLGEFSQQGAEAMGAPLDDLGLDLVDR